VNGVIEGAVRQLAPEILALWDGSCGVDATPIKAFARPTTRRTKDEVAKYSADSDAAWYTRTPGIDKDTGKKENQKPGIWGYELSNVVMGWTGEGPAPFPLLVVAMAVLHQPGRQPGRNAVTAFVSLRDRGHPAGIVGPDRLYNSQKPEDFQLPVRALGYRFAFDYKIDQLGIQGSHAGANQVEGAWMCPALPNANVDATADHRAGKIDDAVFAQRIAGRLPFVLDAKGRPNDDGDYRLSCPALGPNPKVRCPRRPTSMTQETAGLPRADPTDLPEGLPLVCEQQSVTIPPTAGAKHRQDLVYGTVEHSRIWGALRNASEGMHGFMKDSAFEGLGDAGRRRVRGVAAQSLFVAFAIFGANLRKIDSFNRNAVDEGNGLRSPRSRRRVNPSLRDFLPSSTTARLSDIDAKSA
jgi:hypothetical protein